MCCVLCFHMPCALLCTTCCTRHDVRLSCRPPLVTALRAGHGREVISLLVEPVVKHREGRRQDAAVEGLLDDRTTRW